MRDTRAVNRFLLAAGLRIRSNPAVSPDLCLDPHALEQAVRGALPALAGLVRGEKPGRGDPVFRAPAGPVDLYPASELDVGEWRLFVVEERATGDAGLLVDGAALVPLPGAVALGDGLQLVPLLWEGLAPLKNLVQERRPGEHRLPRGARHPLPLEPRHRRPLHDAPLARRRLGDEGARPLAHREPELHPARARLRRRRDARGAASPRSRSRSSAARSPRDTRGSRSRE